MSDRSLNSKIIQHPEVKKAMDKYKDAKKNNKKDKIKYNKTKRKVSQLEDELNDIRITMAESQLQESDDDRYDTVMHHLKMKRRNLQMEKQDVNRTSDILKKSKKQLNNIDNWINKNNNILKKNCSKHNVHIFQLYYQT